MKTVLPLLLIACASPRAAKPVVPVEPVVPEMPDVPTQSAEESQQKFETLLRRGGSLFVIEDGRCEARRVEAQQTGKPDRFFGHIWRVRRFNNQPHKVGYGYAMGANDRTIWLNGLLTPDTVSSCTSPVTITYGIDRVDANVRYYLSSAGCREALTNPREMVVEQGCKP